MSRPSPTRLLALLLLAGAGLPASAQDGGARAAPAAAARQSPASESTAQRCERLLREYDRSAQCYARYKTVTGVREEAFRRCGPPLKDPAVDCPRVR